MTGFGAVLLFASPNLVAQDDAAPPQLSDAGADTCLGCHNSPEMLVIFATAHGQQADPESPMANLQCESCHGAAGEHADRRRVAPDHAAVISFGIDAMTPAVEQDQACHSCHVGDVQQGWYGSIHERNEISCSSCHSVHTERDPVMRHVTQNDVCFDCHREQQVDSRKPSTHPLRSDSPVRVASMVCTDCHVPHESTNDAWTVRETTNQVCFECHADYRGPFLFEHAPASEDCALCHEPHGSVHAPLLTQRPPLLCQSCHSQAGHPSISFSDDSLPGRNPSSMVLQRSCMNCHTQVHGSNHPSGNKLMR